MSNTVALLQRSGLPAVFRHPKNDRQSSMTYITYGLIALEKGYVEGSRSELIFLPIPKNTPFTVKIPGDLVRGYPDDVEVNSFPIQPNPYNTQMNSMHAIY